MARSAPRIRKARAVVEPTGEHEPDVSVPKKPKQPMNATKVVQPKSQTGKPLGSNRI